MEGTRPYFAARCRRCQRPPFLSRRVSQPLHLFTPLHRGARLRAAARAEAAAMRRAAARTCCARGGAAAAVAAVDKQRQTRGSTANAAGYLAGASGSSRGRDRQVLQLNYLRRDLRGHDRPAPSGWATGDYRPSAAPRQVNAASQQPHFQRRDAKSSYHTSSCIILNQIRHESD